MFYHSIIMFLLGWVLWFVIDKHPASLGAFVPAESGDLLANFQMAVDMLKAGYWKASFVFIWKAHYIVLSLVAGIMSSFIFQTILNMFRQRKLRGVMRAEPLASDETDSKK